MLFLFYASCSSLPLSVRAMLVVIILTAMCTVLEVGVPVVRGYQIWLIRMKSYWFLLQICKQPVGNIVGVFLVNKKTVAHGPNRTMVNLETIAPWTSIPVFLLVNYIQISNKMLIELMYLPWGCTRRSAWSPTNAVPTKCLIWDW